MVSSYELGHGRVSPHLTGDSVDKVECEQGVSDHENRTIVVLVRPQYYLDRKRYEHNSADARVPAFQWFVPRQEHEWSRSVQECKSQEFVYSAYIRSIVGHLNHRNDCNVQETRSDHLQRGVQNLSKHVRKAGCVMCEKNA